MFEWDDNKNNGNIAKHGIDFEAAKLIWLGPVIEVSWSLKTGQMAWLWL